MMREKDDSWVRPQKVLRSCVTWFLTTVDVLAFSLLMSFFIRMLLEISC